MPRFDPETIAALAEGRLSSDEAARVEAAIASDPAALHELELQRAARAALDDAPTLVMTELERAAVRASVAAAVGMSPEAETTTSTTASTGPRRVPWGSLGIAATALLGLIAIVPVVGLLNTGGGDDADTALAPIATTAAERAAGTSGSDVADDTGETTAGALNADGSFDASQEAPGSDVDAFGSSTTAPRVATTTLADPATEGSTTSTEGTPAAQGPFDEALLELSALHDDPEAVEQVAKEALQGNTCWSEDTANRGGEDPGDRWSFEYTTEDGEQVVVIYFQYDPEGNPGPFTVYETTECATVGEIPDAP